MHRGGNQKRPAASVSSAYGTLRYFDGLCRVCIWVSIVLLAACNKRDGGKRLSRRVGASCDLSPDRIRNSRDRPRHPRRQRHSTLQRLRHHPHQHHLPRRGAGEVEDDEGVVDGGFVGADADAGRDGGDLVAREDVDGAGGSIQSDGVDEDDAVVAGEVGGEVEGGGAEVFEGGVGGERVIRG